MHSMLMHVLPLKILCCRLYTCVGLKTMQVLCLPLRLAVMLEKVCPSARLIQLSVAHLAMYPRLSTCVAEILVADKDHQLQWYKLLTH